MNIGREKYYQAKYEGFVTFKQDCFAKMVSAKPAVLDKRIQGVPSYRITDNLAYRQAFQFEPPKLIENQIVRLTEKFMYTYNAEGDLVHDPYQSDIAYLTLNCGFIPNSNSETKHNFSPRKK